MRRNSNHRRYSNHSALLATSKPANFTPSVSRFAHRRMSKAERKRAKSGKAPPAPTSKSKSEPPKSFKSSDYIEYDRGFTQRDREVEAALQPSAGDGKSAQSAALEMEQHMLDIVGDENIDLVKKQRIMRWDKSKRKYIQTTVGDEAR